jgi:hypothetical protein
MQQSTVKKLAASALIAAGLIAQQPEPAAAAQPKPAVDAALGRALAKARTHNKRVLAVFAPAATDWAATLKKDKILSRALLYEFEVVQPTDKDADALATSLGFADAVQQKPALAVLAADGKLLAKLLPAEFMTDDGLSAQRLLEKLKPHYAPPVDAEQKLAQALAVGKQDGRSVFIRFDAPW